MQVSVTGTITFWRRQRSLKPKTLSHSANNCMQCEHSLSKEVILGKWWITVCYTASNNGMSVWNVETIIHEHIIFKKACAQWIPKCFYVQPEGATSCCVSPTSAMGGKTILDFVMACDMLWLHYLTPEPKLSSTEWHHKWYPPSKIIQDTTVGWQNLDKCVLVSRWTDSSWFSSTKCNNRFTVLQ